MENQLEPDTIEHFYSLRNNFIVIGLTGRVGAGCSTVANKLANPDFIKEITPFDSTIDKNDNIHEPERVKYNLCIDYLKHEGNFTPFKRIVYKNVLLLHLIFEASKEKKPEDYIIKVLTQNGSIHRPDWENRFDSTEDKNTVELIGEYLKVKLGRVLNFIQIDNKDKSLLKWLCDLEGMNLENSKLLHETFIGFAEGFFEILNKENVTKRTRFIHDIANNLRTYGYCVSPIGVDAKKQTFKHVYTVAETINRLIKIWRKAHNDKAVVVIDSLKNSLELMYFKEKFSGFYMVAVNKGEKERERFLLSKEDYIVKHVPEILRLDNTEYKPSDFNSGKFGSPDTANCIQKSDYHIFHTDMPAKSFAGYQQTLDYQLVKLLSLIAHPGLITPTALERTMQIAFNAKYNSGCISRQVGAVITNQSFVVKSIGWNDVAENQMPCKLRKLTDLVSDKSEGLFSEYEKNGGDFQVAGSFKELAKKDVEKANLKALNGRHCAFCFKSLQNAYEGEKNQVHTRSLHAEENAMMQITKHGGRGLKGGILFTTASPCELCSKKAFQLGITKVYYIDPYPGIATTHTLKNGIDHKNQPDLIMFRGAVGRAYHKLYEPYMSYKDEIMIRTGFKPSPILENSVKSLTKDKIKQDKILNILKKQPD